MHAAKIFPSDPSDSIITGLIWGTTWPITLRSTLPWPGVLLDLLSPASCLAPPCLTALIATKHEKGSLIFGARLVGLLGLKHVKG